MSREKSVYIVRLLVCKSKEEKKKKKKWREYAAWFTPTSTNVLYRAKETHEIDFGSHVCVCYCYCGWCVLVAARLALKWCWMCSFHLCGMLKLNWRYNNIYWKGDFVVAVEFFFSIFVLNNNCEKLHWYRHRCSSSLFFFNLMSASLFVCLYVWLFVCWGQV